MGNQTAPLESEEGVSRALAPSTALVSIDVHLLALLSVATDSCEEGEGSKMLKSVFFLGEVCWRRCPFCSETTCGNCARHGDAEHTRQKCANR